MNMQASALRFFFTITLGRADLAHQLARTHYPRKLPRVLAREQVARLIEAAPGPGLKYRTALSIAYGAGLRGGEVVMLRVGDIDSKRMLIRVAAANNGAPAQPRLPHGGRGRGARQLGHAAYTTPFVRHASFSPREMRQHPIGTGPFKFLEFKPKESIRVSRPARVWRARRAVQRPPASTTAASAPGAPCQAHGYSSTAGRYRRSSVPSARRRAVLHRPPRATWRGRGCHRVSPDREHRARPATHPAPA